MTQPLGFIYPNFPNHICKLQQALYRLKQHSHIQYNELETFILSIDFSNARFGTFLFICAHDGVIIHLLVYVEDLIITCYHLSFITIFIKQPSTRFPIKDLRYIISWVSKSRCYSPKVSTFRLFFIIPRCRMLRRYKLLFLPTQFYS